MIRRFILCAICAMLSACATPPSQEAALGVEAEARSSAVATSQQAPRLSRSTDQGFAAFRPRAQSSRTRIDYAVWSDMLNGIVFNMGPSTRQYASTPASATGTRMILGHDSPFRLEGNRVLFSFLNEDFTAALTDYKEELVDIGNRLDLTRLSRNEQLAYWLNLHNVLAIETIAKNYPIKEPSRIRVYGVRYDEAKLVVIKGVPISMQDIRVNIVYPNWRSPDVIYGFFRGDIGGPRISSSAFAASNVAIILGQNAEEFVNSLRGVADGRGRLLVSRVYEEAQPFFFPDWEADLRAHLKKHLRAEVLEEINIAAPIDYQRYELAIADLAGGDVQTSLVGSQILDDENSRRRSSAEQQYQNLRLPPGAQRAIAETQRKLETLKERGWSRGRVIILDIPTEDPDKEVD